MAANINNQAQLLMLLNQACMNTNTYPATSVGSNLPGLLASMASGLTKVKEPIRCIWVKGIPEDYQDADKLVNIFGIFGNLQKIKLLDNKPDVALMEMTSAKGAEKAIAIMNGKKINGSLLQVSLAKSNDVKIKSDDNKSKDYTKNKEHCRYFTNKSKVRRGVMRLKDVSNKIVVGYVPEGKFDQLKKHIVDSGLTVKSFEGDERPKVEDKPSTGFARAFVEFATFDDAVSAIANLHNTWPNKFGSKKTDKEGRSYGLSFSFAWPNKS